MELISQICSASGKTEEEVKKLIEEKQKELSGLVSEDGAAHIIANELGVELNEAPSEQSKFCLHDLMTGMNSVDVFARVQAVFSPREFIRKGGKSKVVSLEISDETATVRLVLWGEHTDIAEKLHKNDILHLSDCYVKEGMSGIELHAGNRAKIEASPKDAPELPEINSNPTKISDLKPGINSVDVQGRIVSIFPQKPFSRKDGSAGKVTSILLGDDTGTIRVSLWAENSDAILNFSPGDPIIIESAYTREGLKGTELQVGWRGRPIKTDATLPPLKNFRDVPERIQISSVKEGETKEVRGAITTVRSANTYSFCPKCRKKIDGPCPQCGEVTPDPVLIVNLTLDDGTGQLPVVLFRNQAEKLLGKPDSVPNPMESARTHLGQEIIVSGPAKFSTFTNALEMSAYELRIPDPGEEEKLLSKNTQTIGGKDA